MKPVKPKTKQLQKIDSILFKLALVISITCSCARPFTNINLFPYKIIWSGIMIFALKYIKGKEKEKFKGIIGI